MTRPIEFREFNPKTKEISYWGVGDITNGINGSSFTMPQSAKNNIQSQYTGLKDKNGVKIFEGDIVTGICSSDPDNVCQGLQGSGLMGKRLTGYIEYSDLFAQFYFTTEGITFLSLFYGIKDIEVIGNIHENPELLNN